MTGAGLIGSGEVGAVEGVETPQQTEGADILGRTAIKKEIIRPQIGIIDYGSLSDIDWPGSVSARQLVEAGNTSDEIINEAVKNIDNYYVGVSLGAKTRPYVIIINILYGFINNFIRSIASLNKLSCRDGSRPINIRQRTIIDNSYLRSYNFFFYGCSSQDICSFCLLRRFDALYCTYFS